MMYVTTSWDDGHVHDIKLAALLGHYGVKGTFYISKEYPAIGRLLTEEEIKELSKKHEVGAHTLTHPDLTKLDVRDTHTEIVESKKWLEKVTGKEVSMFCYPSGRYNAAALHVVHNAGFKGARTVYWPSIHWPAQPFEMGTTLPVYPLPFRKMAGNRIWWRKLLQPLFERYKHYRQLGVPVWRMYSWGSAACAAFDFAYKNGDTFHLWGHSWEIENYGMWKELEIFMAYVASRPNIKFVTNSEMLAIAKNTIQMLGDGTYGSWAMSPQGLHEQSVVYSFGVGEDASWDTALIKKYNNAVHAFDPTPKSIEWIAKQNLGEKFIFHKYGLAAQDGCTSFFAPLKEKNVSYSPFDLRGTGQSVDLPVKRLQTIMQELGHTHIDILKMDIEGFEYEVIEDMLAAGIFPTQILVEFHHRRKEVGIQKTTHAVQQLILHGYKILHVSKGGDEYSFFKI